MKIKALAAACAGLVAGNALALDPSVTPDVTVFLAGSSALRAELEAVMKGNICSLATGEGWTYLDAGLQPSGVAGITYNKGGAGSDMRAYYCVGQSTLPATLAGKNVLVYYRANGGSVMGTTPVGNAVAISRFDLGAGATQSATFCGTANTSGAYTCSTWTVGSSNIVTDVPAIGMSDVEPALFNDGNNQPSAADCATGGLFGSIFADACPGIPGSTFSSSNSTAVTAQVMGIVVNNALYTALQNAQNLSINGTACSSAAFVTATVGGVVTTSTINDFTSGACRPNLGRAQLRSIMQKSGTLQANVDLSGLLNGYALASGGTASFVTGTANTSVLCRRSGGSGTQAAFNALLLASGCQTNSPYNSGFNPQGNTAFGTAATTKARAVIENPSSGDVKTCLTSYGTTALGILSVDQIGTNLQTDAFHFVKIDGGDPLNSADVQYGHYDFVVESYLNAGPAATNAGTPAADLFAALTTGFQTTTSKGTYLLSPVAGRAATIAANQVAVTRGGTACKPLSSVK